MDVKDNFVLNLLAFVLLVEQLINS